MIRAISVAASMALLAGAASGQEEYDLVIVGARVVDPETMLDQVRNIGITGNEIAIVTRDASPARMRLTPAG